MFGIFAEDSVDDNNAEMFSLLLSSSYTESRPFLLLTPPHQWVGWGCTRSWEGTQLGQLTPADQRDMIPYDVMLSIWSSRKKEERGDVQSDGGLSSQVTAMCDGALLSWRWLNTCLPRGSSEWILCFALLAWVAFALPIKLSLSQPMSFLTFTLPILSLTPQGGSERAAVWGLAASGG